MYLFLTAADSTGAAGGGASMILMFVVLIAVFYFFMIRPENKRKKEAQQMRDSLKVGDNITTDHIMPAGAKILPYRSNIPKLSEFCFAVCDKEFAKNAKAAGETILVGGSNYGQGSSREHAPVAIKASGISCVIAANFARIFYRNAINIGLAILECPAASAEIENGDEVTVDFDTGVITDVTKGTTYQAEPFPPFIKDMIARGGLMASLKAKEAAK